MGQVPRFRRCATNSQTSPKKGGVGAVGSRASRFFHPGERVCKKYPLDAGLRCTNVIITGEGVRQVRNKPQQCYLVTIPKVEGECFIVKGCFRVEVSPKTIFESEFSAVASVAPHPPLGQDDDRAAVNNVVPNVRGSGNVVEEIAELCAEGIKVDDNTEPLTRASPPPPAGSRQDESSQLHSANVLPLS